MRTETSLLDTVYKGSIEYARAVGEKLKDNVYEALRRLTEGFLKYPKNNLSSDNLANIHDNSLIYLYRLLFILYAESLDLLPVNTNKTYGDAYSFKSIKEEIAKDKKALKPFSLDSTKYWDSLSTLFDIINMGNKRFDVPAYNGGLFDPSNHPFLDEKNSSIKESVRKVPDKYLADVIDLLARTDEQNGNKAFVDYRSLNVQHLGNIYEGLLEYKVRHTDKELMVVRDNKKEIYVPVGEKLTKQQKDTGKRIYPGEVYLETDKGERKATGSYYTPEYIVEYIVKNTIDPLCYKIDERIKRDINDLEEKIKTAHGTNREIYKKKLDEAKKSFDDEVLKINVLDPAMESGHFLVSAVDRIAEQIATNPYAYEDDAPEDDTAIDYWKRKVVENCIYGVDVNPLAVELAKLSLWLKTVSKNKPLSFLDHHLRCGNSLIGSTIEDIKTPPKFKKGTKPLSLFDESKLTQDISTLLGDYKIIERLPSNTIDQIKEKERILRDQIDTRREKYIKQANLWTSIFFGNKMEGNIYQDVARHLLGDQAQIPIKQARPYLEKTNDLSSKKKFFHWELEFPEVYFDYYGKKKQNPGFDAVIGNPPYVFAREKIAQLEKDYYVQNYISAQYQVNTYLLFIEQSIDLIKKSVGRFNLIVPNSWLMISSAERLRKLILDHTTIKRITNLQGYSFENVNVETIILDLKKSKLSEEKTLDVYQNNEERKFELLHSKTQATFLKNIGFEFQIFISDKDDALINKIQKNTEELDDVYEVKAGLKAYEAGKGKPKQTSQDVKNRIYDYNYKFDSETYKYLEGKDIWRFSILWGRTYLRYGECLAAPRDFRIFSSPVVIIREITAKHPHSIISTYSDCEEIYLFNMSNIAILQRSSAYDLRYLTAILNSSLMSYYFMRVTPKSVRQMFPKIILKDLRKFPIKKALPEEQKPFIKLVDRILLFNREFRDFTLAFTNLIQAENGLDKLGRNLENWYNLEFKEFIKELEKRIKPQNLSLHQKSEWLQHFETEKAKALVLKNKIELTELEIDKMVDKLYNLSTEEIALVEESAS